MTGVWLTFLAVALPSFVLIFWLGQCVLAVLNETYDMRAAAGVIILLIVVVAAVIAYLSGLTAAANYAMFIG